MFIVALQQEQSTLFLYIEGSCLKKYHIIMAECCSLLSAPECINTFLLQQSLIYISSFFIL